MKKAFILAFLSLILIVSSCTGPKQAFSSSSKVEIWLIYPGDEGSNRVIFSSQDATEITKVAGFISTKDAPMYKCGYSGKMVFTTAANKTEVVEFNFDENCPHAKYMVGDNLKSKVFTQEGIDFVKSLIRR